MGFFDDVLKVVTWNPVRAINNMPTKEELADRWIRENVPHPDDYNATLATLSSDITKWANTCGDHVHQRNPLYSRANGRSICQGKIEQLYTGDLLVLKNQEKGESDRNKKLADNTQLYYLIALVVIVMIIIVLIIKS